MNRKTLGLIFSGISIVGVCVTAIVSAVRARKYDEILEKEEGNKKKAAVKTYWPVVATGAATIGGIVLAEGVNFKEIGIVTGVAAGLAVKNERLNDILESVKPKLSEKDAKLLENAKKTVVDVEDPRVAEYIRSAGPSVEETGRGDLLCYECFSGRWFRSSEEAVRKAIKAFTTMFELGAYVCLNDFYDKLGIETTRFGHTWGWPSNPDYYDGDIDIDATLYDDFKSTNNKYDEEVLCIDIYTLPMECWQEV